MLLYNYCVYEYVCNSGGKRNGRSVCVYVCGRETDNEKEREGERERWKRVAAAAKSIMDSAPRRDDVLMANECGRTTMGLSFDFVPLKTPAKTKYRF